MTVILGLRLTANPLISLPVRLDEVVHPLFIGLGTVVNVATVLVGATIGLLIGNRLSERVRTTVTQVLGLVTIVLGLQNAWLISDPVVTAGLGPGIAMVVVVAALLVGGGVGTAVGLSERLDAAAGWAGSRVAPDDDASRFGTALMTSSLVFCVGPLTIIGSLNEGLGRGADQLLVKSVLDGFAAMAFAASLGAGVLASAVVVGLVQGSLTVVGYLLSSTVSVVLVDVLTATGGVILLGLGLVLLKVVQIKIADLLPALVLAPLLAQAIIWLR